MVGKKRNRKATRPRISSLKPLRNGIEKFQELGIHYVVARHMNPRAPASRNFKSKSKKAYEFLRANGFGYASRSLQRIAQANRTNNDLIFRIEKRSIQERASQYVSKHCYRCNYGVTLGM